MNKEIKNKIIKTLDKVSRDYSSDYGLPTYDDGQMAIMREAIQEVFDEFKSGDVK